MESSDLIFKVLKEIHPTKIHAIDYIMQLSEFLEDENSSKRSQLSKKYANLDVSYAKRQVVEDYVKTELKFEIKEDKSPEYDKKIQKILEFLQSTQNMNTGESSFFFGQIFEKNSFQFPDSKFMDFYFLATGLQNKEATFRVAL